MKKKRKILCHIANNSTKQRNLFTVTMKLYILITYK